MKYCYPQIPGMMVVVVLWAQAGLHIPTAQVQTGNPGRTADIQRVRLAAGVCWLVSEWSSQL